jgi:hypothetical protein
LSLLLSKRGVAAVAAVGLLALFLIRPGADQLRTRIGREISLGLGRQVEISSVSVHLLPRPGFDLQNFVVHEDPAFGVEPTLRASEVSAALRLTSLFRGRLEIARLSLTEPSINLARNSGGRWNLENLLERADQTHVAPTGKNKTEVRPGFPYIEASGARINFKFGQEKTPYTLTDADFSVWQDSENTWGMRLRAQPVRTDFNLSDTGTIRMQGSWQRAESLRNTPLQFLLQWDQSQLGQATTLLYGSDQGWRGTVGLSAALTGTAANLSIRASVEVDDFRRYDLDGGGPLRLAANCSAHYAPLDHAFSTLSCRAPVAGGFVALEGGVSGVNNSLTYDLHFAARVVPMQSLVAFARHTKKNIPVDLAATGTLDAAFQFQRENGPRGSHTTWSGQGETRDFGISSVITGTDLFPDKIPFSVSAGTPLGSRILSHNPPVWAHIAAGPHLEVGPFKLSLGRPAPAVVNARASRWEYGLSIQGEAGIRRLLQLARSVGLPAAQPNADGIAKIDLQSTGSWSAFSPVTTLGQAQLRSVHAEIRGLNQPLEIASANVVLLPSGVEVNDVTASLAGSSWRGSLTLPRQCGVPAECLVRFNLHADTVATDEWSDLLSAHPRSGPWYHLFASNPQTGNSYLLALHATGQLTANHIVLHKLAASQVSATLELESGILRLSDLKGVVLGGRHRGEWKADFTVKPPEYSGSGKFQDVDLEQLGQAMHDGWVTGTGAASYHARAAGLTASELIASADASLQVDELEGTLPHIVLDSEMGPLRMRSFTGRILLQRGKFEIAEGSLVAPDGDYQVSGTASLGGVLNLKLVRANAGGFTIVGPLTAPSVTQAAAAEARAALKP